MYIPELKPPKKNALTMSGVWILCSQNILISVTTLWVEGDVNVASLD